MASSLALPDSPGGVETLEAFAMKPASGIVQPAALRSWNHPRNGSPPTVV
jgi:hypothetical protein